MTHEELNEVLTDIRPILLTYAPSIGISVEIENRRISLIPKENGFTGHFLNAIGAYFKEHSIRWLVDGNSGRVTLEIF